ncbi:MAG TPA: SLC13 family permease [Candidatus Acidoferrales bacterium]|nr:SLC13 family permease [Candidatus Acidoferrales bacterium]
MAHISLSFAQSHWVPAAIFLATYVLIAVESGRGSHLDRTAAAFCGAVAMVLVGVVALDEAYKVIDWNTILFLLGMMILVAHFQISGLFDWIALRVALVARTRFQLLFLLVLTSGILSAFFVNDTICLVLTPIVLVVTHRLKLPPVPYLIAVAVSANVGSVMSVTGNPQNALVGISAHFSFLGFLGHLAPVSLIGLGITVAVLAAFFRREVLHQPLESQAASLDVDVKVDRVLLFKCALAAALVIVFWVLGYSFPMVAISVGAFILVVGRVKAQNVYQRIDWELLLFFASLFVVIRGFQASGLVNDLIGRFHHALEGGFTSQLFAVSGVMLILSNLVSNVPAVLLFRPLVSSFPNSHFIWLAVASASTLAGNATPISSVANLIVLQQAGKHVRISFWQFAKVGLVITLLTTLLDIGILALEHRFFPGT